MMRRCMTPPTILLLHLISASNVCPCPGGAGSAVLDANASACVSTAHTLSARTLWTMPHAFSAAPFHVHVAGLSLALDGCGNHTTQVAGMVQVHIQGFPCPADPGEYVLDTTVALPPIIPSANYTIQLDGTPLFCAQMTTHLGGSSGPSGPQPPPPLTSPAGVILSCSS